MEREPTNRHTCINGLAGGRREEEGCLEGFGEREEGRRKRGGLGRWWWWWVVGEEEGRGEGGG